MLPPPGFEPQVRAERQDVSRACGPADLRETSEDCQRQPQLNPGGASRVSGVIHIGANMATAIKRASAAC